MTPLAQSLGRETTSKTGAMGPVSPIWTTPTSTPKNCTARSVRSLSQSNVRRKSSLNWREIQMTVEASRPVAYTRHCSRWEWVGPLELVLDDDDAAVLVLGLDVEPELAHEHLGRRDRQRHLRFVG